MTQGSNGSLCVVLNNQHEGRIDEYVEVNKSEQSRLALFQPYTEKHLVAVHKLMEEAGCPVPVFFVTGRFGESVDAVGVLHSIEFTDDMSRERKAELGTWASKYDDPPVYALNVLTASNLVKLRSPLALSRFIKRSNDAPLSAGSWTASVCHGPSLAEVLEAI